MRMHGRDVRRKPRRHDEMRHPMASITTTSSAPSSRSCISLRANVSFRPTASAISSAAPCGTRWLPSTTITRGTAMRPGAFPTPVDRSPAAIRRAGRAGDLHRRRRRADRFRFCTRAGRDDGFLDLAGWTDGQSVSPNSNNRFANLDQIEKLYNSATTPGPIRSSKAAGSGITPKSFDLPRLRPY